MKEENKSCLVENFSHMSLVLQISVDKLVPIGFG